jgi:hypothetical protein
MDGARNLFAIRWRRHLAGNFFYTTKNCRQDAGAAKCLRYSLSYRFGFRRFG